MIFSLFEPVDAKKPKIDRIKELQKLQENELLIELDKETFTRYIIEPSKRDYDVFIYYTLSKKCEHCVSIEGELKEVAYSYIQSDKHKPSDGSRPIFFAKVEYNDEKTGMFFAASDFSSVPILGFANSELKNEYYLNYHLTYIDKYLWKFSSQDFNDAGKLLEHVNKLSGENVEQKYTMYRIMAGNALIFSVIGVLFFFKDNIGSLLQNKYVWIVGTSLIFIQCVGGIAFNMIHKVPTFKYAQDSNGEVYIEEYFQKSQRSQYSGEGYMISMLMFTIGALMVVYTYVNRIKSQVKREVICLALIVAIFFGVTVLQTIFSMKASHYNPTFYPPEGYMKGPLSVDQGTNI